MKKISVLMSTYNEPLTWIKESVESIINQTYSNIEIIIIIDNPQNMGLIELLEEYEKKYKYITVCKNSENLGLTESLNKGLKLCSGEYIARMDADDYSLPQRLEKQLQYIEKYNYDLVGCDFEIFNDETIIRTVKGAYSFGICKTILPYESCVAHPTWLVKKSVYRALNGYRNIDASEDFDFLNRAILNGFKIGNVPCILLRYRDNQESISHKKNIKQQVITRFMSEYFSRRKNFSIEEYLNFLESKKYRKLYNKEKKVSELENIFKNSENKFFIRIKAFLNLITSLTYIKKKKIRCMVRWKKGHENEPN